MEPVSLGKYTVYQRIGRGSMSDVFRAYDATLNRYVALKTISQSKGLDESVRRRFYREAQSAAGLNHPNIITVYELGEDGDKIFIAMELLEGSDLKDVINKKQNLSLEDKLDLMEQITDGMAYAHSKGIIHRDLKPGNIHIQAKGRVKIMDFGLAKLASSSITKSGMVMGTPNYMSPEQVRGESVDLSSDVFSMGAILYELLSYTKPFKGESLHDTMLNVLRGSRQPLTEISSNVPDALVQVVDKALSTSPHDRFRDGREFLEVLRELRKNPSVTSTAPWNSETSKIAVDQEESSPEREGDSNGPAQSLSGNLRAMHMADLLQWCAIKRKTGTLSVRHGPIEKKLYFRNGRLFSSSSNSPRETLGQLLIRSGVINEEQLFKALLGQERTKLPLGRIVISEGLLEEGELQRLLELKCKESIYDCFLWIEGEFSFEEHRIPDTVPVSFSLDISRVIQEGIDRMDKWEKIRKQFSSRLTTFVLNKKFQEALDSKELTEEEQRILELVDENKNLAEIALELHSVDFYAASRLLELCERGWLRVGEVPEELPYEEQVQELRVRLAEGLQLFQKGEHEKALSAFEAALEIDPHSKANLYVDKISRIFEDAARAKKVPREGVPVLKASLEGLAKTDLAPQECFVLSRITGEWDVRSILKICPFGEIEVLKILERFMDEGIIELETTGSLSH